MKNISHEFGLFIDNIRDSRNVSKEDFVDGILSTRQYQRYLKGEASISIERIVQLVDKLELEFFSVYNHFSNSSNIERQMIKRVYRYISVSNFKNAYDLTQEYKDFNFVSRYYKKLLNIYEIIINHKLLRISRDMALNKFEQTINYPKCLDNNNFNFIELTALLYMAQIINDEKNKKAIMSKLFDILKFHKITDLNKEDDGLVVVYSVFSKLLGSQKQYSEVIFLTKKGIKLCELHKTTNSLSHLYYYCSLGYLGINKKDVALKYVKKAFFTLEVENIPQKYNLFIDRFESHFNIKFSEFKTW